MVPISGLAVHGSAKRSHLVVTQSIQECTMAMADCLELVRLLIVTLCALTVARIVRAIRATTGVAVGRYEVTQSFLTGELVRAAFSLVRMVVRDGP